MDVGKPKREIFIEPLEVPEPLRLTPEEKPQSEPTELPVEEPAKHGV